MTLTEIDVGLILALSTMTYGFMSFVGRILLKSNCVDVRCCCIHCKREHTDKIEELEMKALPNPVSAI